MILRSTILTLLILSFAIPASAQQYSKRGRQFQISLETRYTGSQSVEADGGSKIDIEDDLGWGFGFNYNINRRFSLGAGFTWRSANYVATIIDADDPTVTSQIPSVFDMSTMAVTGTWNVLQSTLTPYVNGSWGWLLVDSNIYAGTQTGCWWYPWWGYVCGDVNTTYGLNTWSAGLGAGVRWEPHRDGSFFLKGGYEYGWTGAELVGGANIFKLEIGLLM